MSDVYVQMSDFFPQFANPELPIDLSTIFSTFDVDKLGKIRRHHWKKRLKISKIVKIENALLKTNSSKSRNEIIWWGAHSRPHHKIACKFS